MQETLLNRNYVLLCAAHFCSGSSAFILLPMLPLYLTGELGVSKSLAGVMISLYATASMAVRPLSGHLVDRYPKKAFLLLFSILFAAACSGYVLMTGLLAFAAIRLMHGGFFSLMSTSMNTVAIENIPSSRLGTGIGIFGLTVSLAMAVAPMIGIELMEKFAPRASFIAAASFAALTALLVLPVTSRQAGAPGRASRPPAFTFKNMFFRAGLMPSLAYLLTIFTYGLISNYVALLAYERGLDGSAGLFFLFLAAGLVLSRFFAGVLLDKGYLAQVIISGHTLIIASLGYMLASAGSWSFLSAGLLLGMGFGMCMPSYQSLIIRLATPQQRGTANSIFYTAMDSGIGLAMLSGGVMADLTSLDLTVAFGGLMVFGSLMIFIKKCLPLMRTAGSGTAK